MIAMIALRQLPIRQATGIGSQTDGFHGLNNCQIVYQNDFDRISNCGSIESDSARIFVSTDWATGSLDSSGCVWFRRGKQKKKHQYHICILPVFPSSMTETYGSTDRISFIIATVGSRIQLELSYLLVLLGMLAHLGIPTPLHRK